MDGDACTRIRCCLVSRRFRHESQGRHVSSRVEQRSAFHRHPRKCAALFRPTL